MNAIDQIVDNLFEQLAIDLERVQKGKDTPSVYFRNTIETGEDVKRGLLTAFKYMMLELIGEDENDPNSNVRWQAYRNELRSELRARLEEL